MREITTWIRGTRAIASILLLSVATCASGQTLYQHWPLDDGDGGIARNLVDDGFEGFIYDWDLDGLGDDGTVWVNDADRGTVIGLNGQTQWVEAGFIPEMTLENDFTWAFWGKLPPEQASPNNDIVLGSRWGENGSDTSPREFIKFTPNRFEYHMNGGFGDDLAYADSNLPLDVWTYNTVVKDGDKLSYFRDGVLRNETTISGGQTIDEPLPIGFGGDPITGAEGWRGFLSDVQMYTSALTPEQITVAQSGEIVADADLFVRYPLDDGGDSDVIIGTGPGAVDDGALLSSIDAGLGPDGNVWVEDEDRGTVLSFGGAYVEAVQEAPIMDLENDFTWTFWSKSDGSQAQTSGSIIIGNRNDFSGADTGEFIKFTNNQIEFRADGSADSNLEWGKAGPDDNRIPNDNNWYHHVVVKDGDKMTYFRNGEPRNEVTLGLAQQSAGELPFAMGGQAAPDSPGGETPMVFLSDVRLYTDALSPTQVAELAGVEIAACNPDTGGDIDGNGKVEFADFLVLSANFGQAATSAEGHTEGDLDCNGTVEFADFLVMSASFGQDVAAASVPEPSSAVLLLTCGLFGGLVRRRRA